MIQEIQKNYSAFIEEVNHSLQGKRRGYLKFFPVGQRIFPFSIPPRIEIILLGPDDLTIKFRRASDPSSPERKRGEWQVGKPVDAVACAISWANTMKQVAAKPC